MSDDRTELTRRMAAECDDLRDDNAKLREQVKQFKTSLDYAKVTIENLKAITATTERERDQLRTQVSAMEDAMVAMSKRESAIITAMERIALHDHGS